MTDIGTLKFDASGSGHRYAVSVPDERSPDGQLVIWLWSAVSDLPSPAEVTLVFQDGQVSVKRHD
jgi:hypothetical protein